LRPDVRAKEIEASAEPHRWFGHGLKEQDLSKLRCFSELGWRKELVANLRSKVKQGRLTLGCGASDERHNHAVALKGYLETRMPDRRVGPAGSPLRLFNF